MSSASVAAVGLHFERASVLFGLLQVLTLVQNEAQQLQQDADDIENAGGSSVYHRQLEEWQRLKGRPRIARSRTACEGCAPASGAIDDRGSCPTSRVTIQLGIVIACVVLLLLCGGAALDQALHQAYIFALSRYGRAVTGCWRRG